MTATVTWPGTLQAIGSVVTFKPAGNESAYDR